MGLFGKLPARGDFLRIGLSRSFCDPWDDWWQRNLSALASDRPDDWTELWLEAPVWRFFLGPDICGPDGVLGLFLPSVDRAGRFYPLTLAAIPATCWDPSFLDAADRAGRDAIANDTEPEFVVANLQAVSPEAPIPGTTCRFETDGAPRVAPIRLGFASLPEAADFKALFDDDASPAPSNPTEAVT